MRAQVFSSLLFSLFFCVCLPLAAFLPRTFLGFSRATDREEAWERTPRDSVCGGCGCACVGRRERAGCRIWHQGGEANRSCSAFYLSSDAHPDGPCWRRCGGPGPPRTGKGGGRRPWRRALSLTRRKKKRSGTTGACFSTFLLCAWSLSLTRKHAPHTQTHAPRPALVPSACHTRYGPPLWPGAVSAA